MAIPFPQKSQPCLLRWLAASGIFWLAAATSRAALAQSQRNFRVDAGGFHLTWLAPPGCPQVEAAASRVRALLGQDGSVLPQTLEVRALLSELPAGGFKLDLELVDGEEQRQRSVQAVTCEEVAAAGALVIALALDPRLALAKPDADPADTRSEGTTQQPAGPAEAPPAKPVAQSVVKPAATPTVLETPNTQRWPQQPMPTLRRSARGSVRWGAGLAALLDSGSLPDLGVGAELGVHGRWRAWWLELGGSWLFPRREFPSGRPAAGGWVHLLTLDVRGCWRSSAERPIGVGVCSVFELGRRHGEAFGAVENGSGNAIWVAPGAGVLIGYRLHPALFSRARFETLLPLERSEFIVENVGKLPAPRWVLRASLGVDADFW